MEMEDQVITSHPQTMPEALVSVVRPQEGFNAVMHRTAADPPAAEDPAAEPERRPRYTAEEAARAYYRTALRFQGARLNFPAATFELHGQQPGSTANFPAAAFQLHGQQPGSTATAPASTSAALARNFMRELAVAPPPPHVFFRGRPPRPRYTDEEAGGQADREEARMLTDIFGQVYAALLPASAMSYSAFKDAPKHVKVISFGGLVIIWIVLIAGMLSRSLARRQLAFRLVSCSAVTLLTFSVASQLSEPTYVVLTALVGGLLNLGIMLLRF